MPAVVDPLRATAQTSATGYSGTYWIFMHAGGGWDPTHLCDPKGRANENENDPMGRFLKSDIRTAGNINYAPLGDDMLALDGFFQNHYQRLLVINGMDTGTNGHDQGTRGTWSGRTAEGHPPIGALIAATHGPNLPMPLIGYGGYLDTQGVTNAVPLGDGGLLHNLAHPSRPDPTGSDENYFGHPDIPAVVQREQQLRLLRIQGGQRLPRIWGGQNELMLARLGQDDLKRVSEALPDDFADGQLQRQVQVALAAYSAGLSVSVSVSRGGFDTHGNHDQNHLPNLIDFVNAAEFAMQEAERLGVADKVAVVMGSDFGRTPGYNGGNGKDHWPISSMMMMGPGIPGNRVIGGTDDRHGPLLVDPTTLAVQGPPDTSQGTRLGIEHVHRALRSLAGVPDSFKAAFPLAGEDLPIFV
ncbi:MAG: DUF1501 domain-containing protein [Myxococcales bacterium]|nr:DUF1501 domain-containing protein [Myxococcales bacterium]